MLQKRALNVLLFVIAAVTGLMVTKMGSLLSHLLEDLFSVNLKSFAIQVVLITLVALLCRIVVNRAGLSKKMIILLILVFLVFSVIYTRYQFYFYQSHPDFGDMKNVPECMKESNYASFWDYLNKGCDLTLWNFVRLLAFKAGCWPLGFFGSGFKNPPAKRKKENPELIDEPEESSGLTAGDDN